MATTQELINSLKQDKINLVNMLNSMGVEASENETFTSLTPKVGKIVTDPILQDKTITITENGTTNITADEGYNGLNNVSVTTNVASSGEKNNIFIQEEEPEIKEGIWVKTNKTIAEKEIKNLEYKTNWSVSETPTPYMSSYQRVIKVGDYLYIFGGRGSAGTTIQNFYRYNLKTHTTEDLTDIPDTYTRGCGVGCVGTDIYIFGGLSQQGNLTFTGRGLKYDTLTDTFTTIASVPLSYGDMLFTTVGTDIYLIGGSTNGDNSGTITTVYKYDTLTDTYTQMANCPKAIRVGVAVTIGTDIYIFNGYSSSGFVTYAYQYNTLTNSYTTRATLPKKYGHNMGGLIGNDVYLIGGYDGSGRNYIYKYDVAKNTFTQMDNAPYVIFNSGYWSDGENLYIVGGQTTGGLLDDIVTYSLTDIEEHTENTLIISTNNKTHKSKINETTSVSYENVYLYDTNDSSTKIIESYNGNGTEWTKN
jgi:hypothetical protein